MLTRSRYLSRATLSREALLFSVSIANVQRRVKQPLFRAWHQLTAFSAAKRPRAALSGRLDMHEKASCSRGARSEHLLGPFSVLWECEVTASNSECRTGRGVPPDFLPATDRATSRSSHILSKPARLLETRQAMEMMIIRCSCHVAMFESASLV